MSLAYFYLLLLLAQASFGYGPSAGAFGGAAYGPGLGRQAPQAFGQHAPDSGDAFAGSNDLVHSSHTGLAMGLQARMALRSQQMQARHAASLSIAEVESLVAVPHIVRDLWLMKEDELRKLLGKLQEGLKLLASMRHMRVSAANDAPHQHYGGGYGVPPGGGYGAPPGGGYGVPPGGGYGAPPGGGYGVPPGGGFGVPGGGYGVPPGGGFGIPGGGFGIPPGGGYGGGVPYGHYGNMNVHTMGVVHDVHVDSNTGVLEKKLRDSIARCESALRKSDILMLEENEVVRKDLTDIVRRYSSSGLNMVAPGRRRFRSSNFTRVDRTIEDDYQAVQNFIASYGDIVRGMTSHPTVLSEYKEVCVALKGVLVQYVNELTVKVKNAVSAIASDVGARHGFARRAVSAARSATRDRRATDALKSDYNMLKQLVDVLDSDEDVGNVRSAYRAEGNSAIAAARAVEDMPELRWALKKDEYMRPGFTVHNAEGAEDFLRDLPQLIKVQGIEEKVLDDVLEKISSDPKLHESISLTMFMRGEDSCRQERLKEAMNERMDEGDWPIKVARDEDEGLLSRGYRKLKRKVAGNAQSEARQERFVKTHIIERAITRGEGIDPDDEDAVALRNQAVEYFVSCLSNDQKEVVFEKAEQVLNKWESFDKNDLSGSRCPVADFDALMLAAAAGWENAEGLERVGHVAEVIFHKEWDRMKRLSRNPTLKERVRRLGMLRRYALYGSSDARNMLSSV